MAKGIVFDAGDTLVRPIGDAWFPGHRFEEILRDEFPDLDLTNLQEALAIGCERLNDLHVIPCLSLDAERDQFSEYYRLVLGALGLAGVPTRLVDLLVRFYVDEPNMEPFPETRQVLDVLARRGITMGVLSNAWPSLDSQFRRLGLRDYFRAFVISGEVGIVKPDERIFAIAAQQMELPPEQLAFIDDSPEHVSVAIGLGFRGFLLDRSGGSTRGTLPTIPDLTHVPDTV